MSWPGAAVCAVQSRYYDSASSAALFYEAEGRTALGTSTVVAGATGASGGGSNVVRNTDLIPTWQAMMSTQATGGGAHLSHVGSFRVRARTYRPTSNTGAVSVRPEWADQDWSGVERHYAHVLLNGVMVWRVLYAWINVGAGMSGVMPWPGREFEERAELGQVFPPAGWVTTRWEVEFARLINDLSGNDDFDFDAALKGFGLLIRDDSPIDLAKRRL